MNWILTLTLFVLTANSARASLFEVAKKNAAKASESIYQKVSKPESVIWETLKNSNKAHPETERVDKDAPSFIKKIDFAWKAWDKKTKNAVALKRKETYPLYVKKIDENSCSTYLKSIMKEHPELSEAFITNRLGETVCFTSPTSDYDQGDESKWLEPFIKGKSPHMDKIKTDKSTKTIQIQISYLLKNLEKKVGVLTLGIKPKRN